MTRYLKKLETLGFALASTVLLVACGNAIDTQFVGKVAVTKDESGQVLLSFNPCGLPINRVTVYALQEEMGESTPKNFFFAAESSKSHPEPFTLDPNSLNGDWAGTPKVLPESGSRTLRIRAEAVGHDAISYDTETTGDSIGRLQPGQLVIGKDKIVSKDEFLHCDSTFK
ncbi:hypothetical protein [Corynebacterium kalinowskii]|uniref:hypothetical protein n=1 Tax=Corynebacterium kalinowskii TaxID=2675216 RepID=UPI0012E108BE|nr:hypothetical protein [Corynebacterium kalinowskii]